MPLGHLHVGMTSIQNGGYFWLKKNVVSFGTPGMIHSAVFKTSKFVELYYRIYIKTVTYFAHSNLSCSVYRTREKDSSCSE